MTTPKVKIITGFRKDQSFTIDAEEAHKAYYLFLNPDKRGVFANGVALRGQDIQSIEPDYNATMGWNPAHVLDAYDYNEIQGLAVDRKIRRLLIAAREVATTGAPELMMRPLSEVMPKTLPTQQGTKELAGKMTISAKDRTDAQEANPMKR